MTAHRQQGPDENTPARWAATTGLVVSCALEAAVWLTDSPQFVELALVPAGVGFVVAGGLAVVGRRADRVGQLERSANRANRLASVLGHLGLRVWARQRHAAARDYQRHADRLASLRQQAIEEHRGWLS